MINKNIWRIAVLQHAVPLILLGLYMYIKISNSTFILVTYTLHLWHVSVAHGHHQVHINFVETVSLNMFFFSCVNAMLIFGYCFVWLILQKFIKNLLEMKEAITVYFKLLSLHLLESKEYDHKKFHWDKWNSKMGILKTLALPTTLKDVLFFLNAKQNVILIKHIHTQVIRWASVYTKGLLYTSAYSSTLRQTF
jgi:hypothetical protein